MVRGRRFLHLQRRRRRYAGGDRNRALQPQAGDTPARPVYLLQLEVLVGLAPPGPRDDTHRPRARLDGGVHPFHGQPGGGRGLLPQEAPGPLNEALPRTVLVVGAGGREHALVRALAASPTHPRVICAPGNAGIAADAACFPARADDIPALVQLARSEKAELVVAGPEVPLVLGLADRLAE